MAEYRISLRKKDAFSVVELMVVIAIVSLLSAYIGISFSRISPKKLDAETIKLVSYLSWAREMAVSRHRDFSIDFDDADGRIYLVIDSDSPGEFLERHFLDVNSISSPDPIIFQPNGTIDADQIEYIDLTYNGVNRRISLFPDTGYIKWQ